MGDAKCEAAGGAVGEKEKEKEGVGVMGTEIVMAPTVRWDALLLLSGAASAAAAADALKRWQPRSGCDRKLKMVQSPCIGRGAEAEGPKERF